MSINKTYLGYNAERLETAPAFAPYSKVIAWYDDENAFVAGDDSGRVLEVDLPFATQEIVNGMLERIRGYAYQPWTGTRAILDPAAELGDGVTINGVYSVLASMETTFDGLMLSDAAAPADEEVDHEYPFVPPYIREVKRNKAKTYSLIKKTASEIRLEVHSLKTETDLKLEELEQSLGTGLDGLWEDISLELEKYSTITQTDSKIELAVSSSKTYTDTKTGEVVAELENYSTITQTDSKIELAVSSSKTYTDTKTGEVVAELENYSTITQTDSKIALAVTGLVNEERANSLIKQQMDSIELSVSSKEGSTTLELTAGGAQLSAQTLDISVKALNIDGKITAEQLNITGAITFGDLDDDTQAQINDRGISAAKARTIITDELVSSPTIIGGVFYAVEDAECYAQMTANAFELMRDGSDTARAQLRAYSNLVELVLGAGSDEDGENGRLYLQKGVGSVNGSDDQNVAYLNYKDANGNDSFLGFSDNDGMFLAASKISFSGTVDFTNATVTGLGEVSAGSSLTGSKCTIEATNDVHIVAADAVKIETGTGKLTLDSGENGLILRSNDGQIAMHLDVDNNWISIYVDGTTFILDRYGLHKP